MPRVSVIIPFRDTDAYIAGCLRSVLGQSLRDLEVICIDNGSTDGSRVCVEHFARSDKRLRLVNCAQAGAGHARNAGMAMARGDFLAFLDADDYMPDRAALERLHRRALESGAELSRGNVAIVQCGAQASTPLATLGIELWWRTDVLTNYDDEPLLWLPVQHQAYLMRRRFVEDNQLSYPGALRGQDAPFLLGAMLKAQRIYCSSELSYAYRKGHRNHAVLQGLAILSDFVNSVLDVRDLLLRSGRVRQWHLVLARTCAYLRRVCPPDYLLSDTSLVALLRTMVEDSESLGTLGYSPYRIESELDSVREIIRLLAS